MAHRHRELNIADFGVSTKLIPGEAHMDLLLFEDRELNFADFGVSTKLIPGEDPDPKVPKGVSRMKDVAYSRKVVNLRGCQSVRDFERKQDNTSNRAVLMRKWNAHLTRARNSKPSCLLRPRNRSWLRTNTT
ncbi:uncharacterized protein LOC143025252 isoform X2 [Oratosquilla oratoria]|uniref:uncharacterized protein LOC143025252 isoform X2 n=1 Tax=Oratosquilla oratoria TaxID=337810 RepID=UPI003F764C90